MKDLAAQFAGTQSVGNNLFTVATAALSVVSPSIVATGGLLNLFFLIALGYCVIKIFFANIKRSGMLLTQIAVGSLYMFSIPKGNTEGFVRRCLNNAVRSNDFDDAQDSTSVLTSIRHFNDTPNVVFSFDVAIVMYNSNGTYIGGMKMKYLKNKTENIIIRLTESEKKLIRLKAEKRNMSITDFIIFSSVYRAPSKQSAMVLRELKRIETILEQIKKSDCDDDVFNLIGETQAIYAIVLNEIGSKEVCINND